ncbi:hypothetical protein NX059_008175 [Plenodomus lindquistii]|nr:hypothetical protein NX059_008175 [Plenodomus lindquistii]
MNNSDLESFLEQFGGGSSWTAKCVRQLSNATNLEEIAEGLVAKNGRKSVELVNDVRKAWGIDMETCQKYCGRQNFPVVFDFPVFTSGVTNYLLPWLGLTAQLPYETGSIAGNFESFCLAVGSPMLSTFSLMSTALNAYSTSMTFAAKFGPDKTTWPLEEAIESAKDFLCGSQQSPIRIREIQFRQLFSEDPQRLRDQWQPLGQRLRSTRRQYTFSLFAQTFFAVVAWILTIIGSYVTSLGQHSEALLLSSGTLWTWLVPIVLGWMAVGVQSREDTVADAIQGERTHGEAALPTVLEASSGFIHSPTELHDALWGKVQGDEACQGPVYNYARILTFPKLRDRIVCEFEMKLAYPQVHGSPMDVSEPVRQSLPSVQVNHDSAHASGRDSPSPHSQAVSTGMQEPVRTNTTLLESNSPNNHDMPYMEWEEVRSSSDWKVNFMIANTIAVFLQWGITGSAIVISYLTEVRGLGCRSGSYLLYGILATSALVLLLASVFLSHHVMLEYQRKLQKLVPGVQHKILRSTKIKWIGRLAVLMRFCGKSFAVINDIWIILSSVFELIGFYESCWCSGVVLGLGDRAWVVLFVGGDKLREEAEASWIGGLSMSLITMISMYLISKAYSLERKQ